MAVALCVGLGAVGLFLTSAGDDVSGPADSSKSGWSRTSVSVADAGAMPGRLAGLTATLVEHPRLYVPLMRRSTDTAPSAAGQASGVLSPAHPAALAEGVASTQQAGDAAPSGPPVGLAIPEASGREQARASPLENLPAPPAAGAPDGVADGSSASHPRPRVFVHFSTSVAVGADDARRVSAYLRARGYLVGDIRPVSFPIATPKVRYFFAADEADARRLTGALAEFRRGMADPRGTIRIEDYAHYRPLPPQGNVEVWLSSGGTQRAS